MSLEVGGLDFLLNLVQVKMLSEIREGIGGGMGWGLSGTGLMQIV